MPDRTDNLALVARFMKAMSQPVCQDFDDMPGIDLGIDLIKEELEELEVEAANLRAYWWEGVAPSEVIKERFTKELADLLYVTYWLAARIGIDLDAAFRLVHQSNMSKLGPDGKPVKREDGKVLKGPNYKAPDLTHIVRNTPVSI
ncbi:hypothetical protein [uncultured Desulfovibrio sp.]|uniref:hypothetical protein n=1 Tax=uncultured Desulfovibrio sp. TaxID=167968 RepID=UPI002619997D|nr:hypothetical protein [uncultured Desulfovibrio sp.]